MIRFVTIKYNEPAPAQDTASVLLGMEGVTVTVAEERVHEYVTTRPRDVRYGSRGIDLFPEKRRLACGNGACPRGTFTECAAGPAAVPHYPQAAGALRGSRPHASSNQTEAHPG